MTIILDLTNNKAKRVEHFNDGETLAVAGGLGSMMEVADVAARAAEGGEGVVLVRVRGLFGSFEVITAPRALLTKAFILRIASLFAPQSTPLARAYQRLRLLVPAPASTAAEMTTAGIATDRVV